MPNQPGPADVIAALPTTQDEQTLARILSAYTVSATAWLVFATLVGIIVALKFRH